MLIPIKPISINKAYRGKRFKSKDYIQFEKDCSWWMKGKKISGEVEIHYKFFVKNFARTDVDNCIKPTQDLLVKYGLIDDDCHIKKLVAEKFKSDEEKMEIEIFKYS